LYRVSWRKHHIIGVDAMGNQAITQAEAGREILSFDIPDEVLKRAASAE
jgi:hypothetical protein